MRPGMRKIITADRCGRYHHKAFTELDGSSLRGFQEIEKRLLFRMVRAGRVTGRRTDTLVVFFQELLNS